MAAPRAHCREIIVGKLPGDNAVAAISGASVLVCNTGTGTPIAQTIYAGETGLVTLANPLSSSTSGIVEFWVPIEQTVDLIVSIPGFASQTVTSECLVALESGAVNLNTAQALANPGDVRVNSESLTWEGATTAHTANSLDQAQTVTGAKTMTALMVADPTDNTKALIFALSGATTGKTATLASSHTLARTHTLPDNTGTIAELNLAQNFTALQEFSAGISPDGTHTLTLPAVNDTLVGKATADTLTNKNLTSPVLNGTPVLGGDLLVGSGGITPAIRTKVISALASGANAALSWTTTNGSGAMLLITSPNADGSAIFSLQGGHNLVTKIAGDGIFTTTAGNAGTTNIYYSAGNARYEIENKTAGPLTYGVVFLAIG